MIGQLIGKITAYDGSIIVVNVNGVGYEVEVPSNCQVYFRSIPDSQKIYTHQVVREDAQLLFGFSQKNIRDVFRVLIKASGVGPKCALAMLSHFSVSELIQCVENQSVSHLVAIKGVGPKLAQKLVVELKGALLAFSNVDALNGAPDVSQLSDVKLALEALGFHANQADKAARLAIKNDQNQSREVLIKQALQLING